MESFKLFRREAPEVGASRLPEAVLGVREERLARGQLRLHRLVYGLGFRV